MNSYYARVCFNSQGWVFPTGEAKALEKNSWVTKGGFGGEEWLFNFAWLMDGFHYAFVQPVNRSFNNVSGQTINVMVYTINQAGDRVYVGEIRSCQVLTQPQAREALKHYRSMGWLKSMKEQVRPYDGYIDIADEEAQHLFNVRFLPSNAKLYSPQRIAGRRDSVQQLNRYSLVRADEGTVTSQWRRRKGTKTPPTVRTITRKGQPGVTYDPIHK